MSRPGQRAGRDDVVAELAMQLDFVRRSAASCGVHPQHLDDFVQSVALTALQRIQQGAFSPSDADKPLRESVRAWLTGIVRFKALDLRRGIAVRDRILVRGPTAEHLIDIDAVGARSAADLFDAKEALRVLGRLKLNAMQREVVRLTAEGYTAREIGERLGTAATHLKRARNAYERAGRREKAKRKR